VPALERPLVRRRSVNRRHRLLGSPDAEGWTTFQARFEHEEQAVFVVLGLGARVDVVEPPALRERTLQEANAVVARAASRLTGSADIS
jgi:predicted DNA-binding transcriptional regulator YafY